MRVEDMKILIREAKQLVAILLLLSIASADYSDVLLISNNNSSVSIQIAEYFVQQRNITHWINVSLPNNTEGVKFGVINDSLLQPAKTYLNSSNGTGINYIVLTKGIQLWTNETESFVSLDKNASSVDTELALVNTAYESSIGQDNRISNPYYTSTSSFSKSTYGVYLVTRLDGYNYTDVKAMIDGAASISKADRNSGLHIMTGFHGYWVYQFGLANQTLTSAGLNVLYNSSTSAQYPANQSNVSYFDTFGCYNFGGCDGSYMGNPNYTWKNGSFASARYSFSAKTTTYPHSSYSQIADYIHEGATGGVGYAVEPWSSGVADPQYIATNYVGGKNFAEMLWSSIPHLSWGAVVFGDPKAVYPSANVSILPSNATVDNDLQCNVTLTNDIHSVLNLTYQWYFNNASQPGLSGNATNVPVGASTNIANLSSANLSVGRWKCSVDVYVLGGYSSSHNSSESNVSMSTNLSSCQSLNYSNQVYYLTQSISANGSTCINITAENVTLDCAGYTITGNNTTATYGIYSNQNNTTITNCNISNFKNGIYFYPVNNGTISNTNASTTHANAEAIVILESNSNTLSNINATSVSGAALYLEALNSLTMENTTATSTTSYAIYLATGIYNSTVSNITATSTSGQAFYFESGQSNELSNITATSTSDIGFYAESSDFNNFTDIFATSISNKAISMDTCPSNRFSGITAESNSSTAIFLSSSSLNNLSNITATANASHGLYLNSSSNNTLTNVTASGATTDYAGVYLLASSDNNFINITATGTSEALGISLESTSSHNTFDNITATSDTAVAFMLSESPYNSLSNVVATSTNNSALRLQTSQHSTITNSTATSNSSSGIYLESGSNNTTIADSTTTSTSNYGINIESSSNNTLTNVTGSSTSQVGMYLTQSSYNAIENSTGNSSTNVGMYISGSNYNSITNCTAISNTSLGIYLGSSNYTIIRNSTATSNTNRAIFMSSGASHNNITNSTINSTANVSLVLGSATNYNTILENNISGVGWVNNSNSTNSFNNSSLGNIYYLANRTPSWHIFDIRDTDSDNWADAGSDWPFNNTTITGNWTGLGGDYHPYTIAKAYGNGSNISTTGVGTLTVSIANNTTINGGWFAGNQSVNISSGNNTLVYFYFNFSNSSINFSKLNITNGTSNGAQYFTFSGMETGMLGKKTVYIYEANTYHNSVCIDDRQNVSLVQITHDCTETDETLVTCDGSTVGAYTCTRTGNTLAITGLTHSGIIQFQQASSSSGNTGGGGSGGGSGSATPPAQTTDEYEVDIGNDNYCTVSIKREIASTDLLSVLTTTLENTEDNCTMQDYVFADTIPSTFAAMADINFSPNYTEKQGWEVQFSFPEFAPGESKTVTYSVASWIPPSRVEDFTSFSMTAKKEQAAVPEIPEEEAEPEVEEQVPEEEEQEPEEQPEQKPEKKPEKVKEPVQEQEKQDNEKFVLPVLSIVIIAGAVIAVAGGIYFVLSKRKAKP